LPVVGNRQKSVLLCSVAALPFLFASPAFSAPQAWDWSGFYAGVTAGAGRSKSREATNLPCTEDPAVPAGYVCGIGIPGEAPAISAALTGSHSKSGFIGGGEAGYNWQIGAAVYGLVLLRHEAPRRSVDLSSAAGTSRQCPDQCHD
jgi:outer membrane immunogenic protein